MWYVHDQMRSRFGKKYFLAAGPFATADLARDAEREYCKEGHDSYWTRVVIVTEGELRECTVMIPIKELRDDKFIWQNYEGVGLDELEKSIRGRGVMEPITIDADRQVIDGFRRLYVSKGLGLKSLPCEFVQ